MNLCSGLFVAACILFSFCGGESCWGLAHPCTGTIEAASTLRLFEG
jgi:hypothetical protein